MKKTIHINCVSFRENLSENLNKVLYQDCELIISRSGKPIVKLKKLEESQEEIKQVDE